MLGSTAVDDFGITMACGVYDTSDGAATCRAKRHGTHQTADSPERSRSGHAAERT